MNDTNVLPEIRQALDDTGMIGIYKTTTKGVRDTSTELEYHDAEGCKILHYCLNLNWTAEITDPNMYADTKHFKGPTYQKMNEQLLKVMDSIRSEHPRRKFGEAVDW